MVNAHKQKVPRLTALWNSPEVGCKFEKSYKASIWITNLTEEMQTWKQNR